MANGSDITEFFPKQKQVHVPPSREPLSQIRQSPAEPKVAEETPCTSPGTPHTNNWDGSLPPVSLASSIGTVEFG